MVDVIPVSAASASASPTAPVSGLTAVQAVVADLSQALQNLAGAIQTNATPTAPPQAGTLTLATALGNVTITLPQLAAAEQQTLLQQLTNLATAQKPLTLSLPPGSPPTQAVLLLPTPATTTTNTTPTTPPPATAALPAPPLPPLTAGQTVSAIILPAAMTSPPPATTPPAAVAPTLTPPATETPVSTATPPLPPNTGAAAPPPPVPLSNAQPQPATTAIPTPTLAPTASPLTLPLAPAPAPAATTSLPTLLQPGNQVALQINAVIPPAPGQSVTTLPPLAANQIAATVIGTGTDGQLIVKAGDAALFVKAQATAPIGTTIIVTVAALKPPPLTSLPGAAAPNYAALPQALAALTQSDPQLAQQMMATRLPQPTETLPAALMLLFAGIKQGNVRDWLGDEATASLLRAGKLDLVTSLSRDLGNAGQPAQDGVVGEWRNYPIPLYSGAQFQALNLYVHHDKNGGGGDNGKAQASGKIRFLIDMRLSKLGAMQIDGFVQPKKIDMILRSENLLPEGLHATLRAAYIKAMNAVGHAGSLNFQVGRQGWMVMRQTAAGVVT